MRRFSTITQGIGICGLALALLMAARTALAQAGGSYDLSWWTVDGGGSRTGGGGYTLMGTAGQPDAAVLTDGSYTLSGGFWGGAAVKHRICLPLVLRG